MNSQLVSLPVLSDRVDGAPPVTTSFITCLKRREDDDEVHQSNCRRHVKMLV